jgi:hypothetical protein
MSQKKKKIRVQMWWNFFNFFFFSEIWEKFQEKMRIIVIEYYCFLVFEFWRNFAPQKKRGPLLEPVTSVESGYQKWADDNPRFLFQGYEASAVTSSTQRFSVIRYQLK